MRDLLAFIGLGIVVVVVAAICVVAECVDATLDLFPNGRRRRG